jgi:hypothetical protein
MHRSKNVFDHFVGEQFDRVVRARPSFLQCGEGARKKSVPARPG